MPFVSRAQARACRAARDPRWDCDAWAAESPRYRDLPEYRRNARKSDEDVYREWQQLVNMSASELRDFLNSSYGRKAGLSKEKAEKLGIRRGQDSARAILRMKAKAPESWTATDWDWARRQVNFIRRMRGVSGPLFDAEGEPTRKLLALLIWGHNPF